MYENEYDPGKYTQTSEKSVTGGRIDRQTDGRDQSTSRLTVPAGGSDNNQLCIYTHNYDILRIIITLLQCMLVHILLHIIISSGPPVDL